MTRALWILLGIGLAAQSSSAQENREYTSKTGNFRILYPDSWKRGGRPPENFEVVLTRGVTVIMIAAAETNATPEDIAEDVETNTKVLMDGSWRESRRELTVAGERSIEDRFSVHNKGFDGDLIVAVFCHQGIAYRVVAVSPNADEGDFLSDFHFVLKNWSFSKDRKDWLKKNEGEPATLAMLGGRIEFQLNRPRWNERTFEEQTSWQTLDFATFILFAGGGWITVEVLKANGSPDQELNRLGHDLARYFADSRIAVARADLSTGAGWSVSVQGKLNGEPRFLRGIAVVEGDLVVRAWIECQPSRREETLRDWKQLTASLVFHAPGAGPQPPAWTPVHDSRTSSPAEVDPVHAVSRPLLNSARAQALLALSPDLSRAAFSGDGHAYVEDLATGRRVLLPEEPDHGSAFAWSADGDRLAFAGEKVVTVVSIKEGKSEKLELRASSLAFGGAGLDLFAAATLSDPTPPFRTSTLLRVPRDGGKPDTLVSFPLSRVTCVAVSPDGKRLAVGTNERMSRRSIAGANLFVGEVNGTGMKCVTEGAEEVTAVAWAADGSSLLFLRRLAVDAEGHVPAWGGPRDVWRVPAAGGSAVNLTRCGNVGGFALAGERIAIEFDDWRIPENARGVFEARVPDLEKATAGLALPIPLDRAGHSRALEARLAPLLAGRKIGEIVPTAEFVAELAKEFSRAAGETCGSRLDFSAESLDVFASLLSDIDASAPLLLTAAGAYYGETLRQVSGAAWSLGPEPLQGLLKPADSPESLAVDVVHPWADIAAVLGGSEDSWLIDAETARADSRRKPILLVHPPSRAMEAVRTFEGKGLEEARRLLDSGDVARALPIFLEELRRFPRNDELALYVVAACDAAGLEEAADRFVSDAVDAGTEVIELLTRRADSLAKSEPAKARELYRRAAHGHWGTCDAFIKLGKSYAATGEHALAESCWRQAWRGAQAGQQAELKTLMGAPR